MSVPLTGLFFQMIESNDISGEKIRMKETVEGEWPLGRRDAGLWEQAGWFCLRAESHLVLHHLPFGERGLRRAQQLALQVRRAAAQFIECQALCDYLVICLVLLYF